MTVQLKQVQFANELADLFYDFLPNKPHPYADQSLSFMGIAQDLGLASHYTGGSKRSTISQLLLGTLQHDARQFCPLIREVVQRGLIYRSNKGSPLFREDVEAVNSVVEKMGFKVPELWDPAFRDSLPRVHPPPPSKRVVTKATLEALRRDLMAISGLESKDRGPAFERFLQKTFEALMLRPKRPFRLVGEQIDGSFALDAQTYLVEAKYHVRPIGPEPLRAFRDKVDAKATWSRGLFISWSGFSPESGQALARGRSTNMIGMTGQDIFFILDGKLTLAQAIRLNRLLNYHYLAGGSVPGTNTRHRRRIGAVRGGWNPRARFGDAARHGWPR